MDIKLLIISVIVVIVLVIIANRRYKDDGKVHGKPSALPMNTAIMMRNTYSYRRAIRKHEKKMRKAGKIMD
ncbi:MAG: hypothetical protein IKG01_07890 [Lachnospiraceae bacterium]|nr:hypothetical protein [Lachnospiraceae bacterium]